MTIALLGNPGHTTLMGTLTVPVSNGVAAFSGLTLDAAGTGFSIEATGSGLSSATTNAFTVTAGPAVKLGVSTEPLPNVAAGSSFSLTAEVEDQYGNVVTAYSGSVSILLAADPTGDTLRGTLDAMISNGVASFSGLTLDLAATGYAIQASSSGLTAATTNPFRGHRGERHSACAGHRAVVERDSRYCILDAAGDRRRGPVWQSRDGR